VRRRDATDLQDGAVSIGLGKLLGDRYLSRSSIMRRAWSTKTSMARVRGEVRGQIIPKRRASDDCGRGSRATGSVGHQAVAASGAIETPTPRPTSPLKH